MTTATRPDAVTAEDLGHAVPGVARPRIDSIDVLRGLVMVLMVLDHTRDYFTNRPIGATDLARTTPALFFTRWITHFCAPVFIFLAGTGAYLAARRGKTRGQLARFLAIRGLWLIVLELTIERFGMTFNFDLNFLPALTLWAIGWSMIALSVLVYLPLPAIAAIGAIMIVGHNAFDGVRVTSPNLQNALWIVLHQGGPIPLAHGVTLFVGYPLIPWVGVMACGYAFGAFFQLEPALRRRWFVSLGIALTLAFVILRGLNVYGDPNPWSVQARPGYTILSFLNCNKYPPSLLYLLMTLGPAIGLLGLIDREPGPIGRRLVTLGRVPLFYYLLQWWVIHILAIAVAATLGEPVGWFFRTAPFNPPPDYGHGLPFVYVMWAVAVLLLYPACRWFAALKRRRRDAWLSYF